MRKSYKIQSTNNYSNFVRGRDNRELDMKKFKKLRASMKKRGFLPEFPIVCKRTSKGLEIKDGQHRFQIAVELNLPIYWAEQTADWDVPEINICTRLWALVDFAKRFADRGKKDYKNALRFAEEKGLAISMAFALLGGKTSFSNVSNAFYAGTFKVNDYDWAELVTNVYLPIVSMNKKLKGTRFMESCMAVCRVEEFDANRLVSGADRCREKLVPYSQREAYLDMLEEVYNYGRRQLFPLKISALTAMRERNATSKKKSKTKAA